MAAVAMSLAIAQQPALPLLLERNGKLVQAIKERTISMPAPWPTSWQKPRLSMQGAAF
jgi:hypothetical protein